MLIRQLVVCNRLQLQFARFYEDVRPGMLLELSDPCRNLVAPETINILSEFTFRF